MDKIRFLESLNVVADHVREQNGIGTLSEKTIHAVLKHYYAPDISQHEKRVEGYIADIYNDKGIIEVQTRNFNTLRKKLDAFLPNHEVIIVYPVTHTKWLRWINPESGEISAKRKSPKIGSKNEIFDELYKIKSYLLNPNLHFYIALLDIEEYRMLDGYSKDKKRGSSRNDGIPVDFAEEIVINSIHDYLQFLPNELEKEFTVKDYQASVKTSRKNAWTALHILNYIGMIEQIGKKGKAFLYQLNPCYSNIKE